MTSALETLITDRKDFYKHAYSILLQGIKSETELKQAMQLDLLGLSQTESAKQQALANAKKAEKIEQRRKDNLWTRSFLDRQKEAPKPISVIQLERQPPYGAELRQFAKEAIKVGGLRACRAVQQRIKSLSADNPEAIRLVYALTERY